MRNRIEVAELSKQIENLTSDNELLRLENDKLFIENTAFKEKMSELEDEIVDLIGKEKEDGSAT